jgi:HEAT repeat protein
LAALVGCVAAPREPPPSTSAVTDRIPEPEIFTTNDDLHLSIRLEPNTVTVGQAPTVVARFENRGSADLFLNQHVIGPAHVVGVGDAIPCINQMDYGLRTVRAQDLIRLAPAASWEHRLEPEKGVPGATRSRFTRGAWTGAHQVVLRYTNSPDCRHIRYDPYSIGVRVWEGRIESPPVPLTVRPLDQESERTLIARLFNETATYDDVSLLIEQNTPRTVDALLKRLGGEPDVLLLLSAFLRHRAPCESWSSISTLVGSSGNRIEQPGAREIVTAFGERCPAVLADLRRVLDDRSQPPNARRHAALLLGRFRKPEDAPRLTYAMRAPADSVWEVGARAGAVEGLAEIGGEEATAALIETLRDRSSSRIHVDIVRVLARIDRPEVIPALVAQLGSSDSNVVVRAILGLRQRQARTATADLVRLLAHPNATLRVYAASALGDLADGSIQQEMQAALADPDENVQAAALFYLAKHGDSSLAPIFESRAGAGRQQIQEAARTGLHYLGTPASVEKVRPLIESRSEAVRRSTVLALELLTFRTWTPEKGTDELHPADFNAWWQTERKPSRRSWAIEALERPSPPDPLVWSPRRAEKIRALEYLDRQNDPALIPVFTSQTRAREFGLRIWAAKALGRFDKALAARHLISEFEGRHIMSCITTNLGLRDLTGQSLPIDCESPDARRDAQTRWSAVANSLTVGGAGR